LFQLDGRALLSGKRKNSYDFMILEISNRVTNRNTNIGCYTVKPEERNAYGKRNGGINIVPGR
jgi:hypothetical protein